MRSSVAIWLALSAAGTMLAGCGGTSGAVASPAGAAAAPITKARAAAYAHAVNLTATDVPGMKIEAPEGEDPEPTHATLQFAHCYGGASPDRRLVKIHSPEFATGRGTHSKFVESRVEVWPTAALAIRNSVAYFSHRGHSCFLRALETLHDQFNRTHPAQLQYGPIRTATVPISLPGVSRSFLTTIAEPRLRDGKLRLLIYRDTFTFISGTAEIELEATGFSKPVPTAFDEQLVALLVKRAITTSR